MYQNSLFTEPALWKLDFCGKSVLESYYTWSSVADPAAG